MNSPANNPAPSPLSDPNPAEPSNPETAPLSARDKKIAHLTARNAQLSQQLSELQSAQAAALSALKDPDAAGTVKRHIKLLHDYNEVRDVAMGLMGLIAEQRGVRVKDIYEEFGVAGTGE
ncbi:MAG: hypothetical protein M1829_002932 [Trizodia sp. TS-e1964]|nr:MAG: hypothetical protein M1829_002932 [Trizodia sp. TS-e1964]